MITSEAANKKVSKPERGFPTKSGKNSAVTRKIPVKAKSPASSPASFKGGKTLKDLA